MAGNRYARNILIEALVITATAVVIIFLLALFIWLVVFAPHVILYGSLILLVWAVIDYFWGGI